MKSTLGIALGTVAAGALLLGACGGQTSGPSGTATLSGSVGGTTFQVASSLAGVTAAGSNESCVGDSDGGQTCTSSSVGQVVFVELTNRSDATCGAVQSEESSGMSESFANLDGVLLGVASAMGTVSTGTYDIVPQDGGVTSGAQAIFATTNTSCQPGVSITATGGTITFSQITSSSVTGSYSVTFGSQGTFTGSFDVDICELPDAGNVTGNTQPVCKQ
jgi:hypothetical protein